jgi:hypothetical protein
MTEILNYTLYFQLLVGVLPIAFSNWKRPFIPLNITLIISAYTTLLLIISKAFSLHNTYIFYSYVFFSFIGYTLFYLPLLSKLFKLLISFSLIIFIIVFITTINKNGHSYMLLVTYHLTLMLFTIYYFLNKIYTGKFESYQFTLNTISLSILIYSTSTILLSYVIELFMANRLWFIHNLIEGISKLIIAYAFWKIPQQYPSQK